MRAWGRVVAAFGAILLVALAWRHAGREDAPAKGGNPSPPAPAALEAGRLARFGRFAGSARHSAPQPGEYVPITAGNVSGLVASIPARADGLDPGVADRSLAAASELAEAIARALALEDYSSAVLPATGLRSASIDFATDLRGRQKDSPNFHWESLNVSASRIDAVPTRREYLERLDDARHLSAKLSEVDQDPPRILLSLRFEVGHYLGGKNRLCFQFVHDPVTGKTKHVGVVATNLSTIPTGPPPPPSGASGGPA